MGTSDKSQIMGASYKPVFSEKDPDRENYERSVQNEVDEVDGCYGDPKDEIFDTPTCTGVAEWSICLLFDVVLLLVEAVIAIWLASSLYTQDLITEYRTILVVLAIPSFINPLLWIKIKLSNTRGAYYEKMSMVFVAVLLFASLNSPFFVFLWHLYQAALESRQTASKSKKLANTFRMVQAILTSVPLLLINMYTLISTLQTEAEGDRVLDFRVLGTHLEKVEFHGLAYLISLINLIRAACLFNERLTYTVMFTIISLPFIILIVFTRLLALSIIIAFLEGQFVASMFIVLFFLNVLFFAITRKRSVKQPVLRPTGETSSTSSNFSSQQTSHAEEDLIESADNFSETSSGECRRKPDGIQRFDPSYRSGKTHKPSSLKRGQKKLRDFRDSCWYDLPRIAAMSIASTIVPTGYSSDFRQHHPRIRGGTFMLLNFLSHSLIIGLALGYTIKNNIPNTIQGLKISNPSIKVQVPDSKLSISAFGLNLGLKMPKSNIDLGSMPAMNASVDTDHIDFYIAVGLPVFLTLLCFPFAIIRATMMELDCFITHKKRLESLDEEMLKPKANRNPKKSNRLSLVDSVLMDTSSCKLKSRMYVSLCCGFCGVFVFPLFSVIAMGMILMSMHH